MKKFISFFIAGLLCVSLFNSCSVTYQLTSEGESFDALTKITDLKKPCVQPNGGDNGKNLVFSVKEDDGSYNIYMKDNVLTQAIIQKTEGKNFNLSPNYCSETDRIAFQHFDRTNFDIYYINATKGKAITQITNTEDNEYNPSWSNDGKLLIFEKGATPKQLIKVSIQNNKATAYSKGVSVTQNQIWIKNLVTSELKMIAIGSFPRFSPDDKKVVFVKYDLNKSKTSETGTIWIIDADGESEKQLTNYELGYATNPCWSPDGNSVVFQLTKTNKTDADIYTINTDGENLKQYTTNKSNDFNPYWSKDGYIYFSSDRGAKAGMYQIWRFKLAN